MALSCFARSQVGFQGQHSLDLFNIATCRWIHNARASERSGVDSVLITETEITPFLTSTESLEDHSKNTWSLMLDACAFVVICRLVHQKTTILVVLVPSANLKEERGVEVRFLRSGRGPNAASKALYKKIADAAYQPPGSDFMNNVRMQFYKREFVLHIRPSTMAHTTIARLRVWLRAVGCPVPKEKNNTHVRASVVQLPPRASAAVLRRTDAGDLPIRVRYKGGKKHAVRNDFVPSDDPKAMLTAEYLTPVVPPTDDRISDPEYAEGTFCRKQSAEDVYRANDNLRKILAGESNNLAETDIKTVLGAIASTTFEDISWVAPSKVKAVPARLREVSVDIDQVNMFLRARGVINFRNHYFVFVLFRRLSLFNG